MLRFLLLLAAIALLTTYEWLQYSNHILRFYSWDLSLHDKVLAIWSLVSKTLVLVILPIAMGFFLRQQQRYRWANAVGLLLPMAIIAWLLLDVKIQTMTGQHFSYYLARLLSPSGLKMIGSPGRLLLPLLLPLVCMAVSVGGTWWLFKRYAKRSDPTNPIRPDRVTPWLLVSGVGIIVTLLICRHRVQNPAVLERLYAALPTRVLLFHPASVSDHGGGAFGVNAASLFQPLGTRFYQASRLASLASFDTEQATSERPNIVLLILESFRKESVSVERMPRLTNWAAEGIVANHHYCGSNCSPQGGFALMYGQLALGYDAVLDTGKDASLCTMLRQHGYESSLLASCDFEYRRMSEFFAEPDFDHVELYNVSREQWPEADQRCLDEIKTRLSDSDRPQFLASYLMSTHYDYRYTPAFESIEVEGDIQRELVSSLQSERTSRIRYRKTLAFMDQLLVDFCDSLDLQNTLVVVTGDHGESIHDDGTLAHGSRLSEIQTRVPMLVRGAGIEKMRLDQPTSHVDLMPTLASLLGISYASASGRHGVSWIVDQRLPDSRLLVHEYPDSWDVAVIAPGLANNDEKLMINIDRSDGASRVLGFAGKDGLIDPKLRKPPQEAKRWAKSFADALGRLEGPSQSNDQDPA